MAPRKPRKAPAKKTTRRPKKAPAKTLRRPRRLLREAAAPTLGEKLQAGAMRFLERLEGDPEGTLQTLRTFGETLGQLAEAAHQDPKEATRRVRNAMLSQLARQIREKQVK